jgi:uncharacterized protein YjbJ (UPF0337 family)
MGPEDTIENKAEELKLKGTEKRGQTTDEEWLQAEGKVDQGESKIKQTGEGVKDAPKE